MNRHEVIDALVHDANGALNTVQLTLELLDGGWPGSESGAQSRAEARKRLQRREVAEGLGAVAGTPQMPRESPR